MPLLNKFGDILGTDRFFKLFKTAVREQGFQISKKINDDLYEISNGSISFTIDTSDARQAYFSEKSEEELNRLVKKLEADFSAKAKLVSFTNSQPLLRFVVMREEDVSPDFIAADFVGILKKVIVYTADDITIEPLDKNYLKRWDVPKEVLFSVADRNMCRLLMKADISEAKLKEDVRALEFKLPNSELCVSLMMCNDFHRVVSDSFGPKFLVVAPSLDSILVLENITNNILEGLGTVIINEYKSSKKPLTTDVLLFDRDGINIAGRFSAEAVQ
jgi:hypothetical protein